MGWAIFGTSVPTQSAVYPRFSCLAEVQGTLFLAFETRFFSHNFFWRSSGFVESDTTASRNFEFRDVVVSDSTEPDENRARFVVLLVSTKRV